MKVSVVYALPEDQVTLELSVREGITAREVALISGMELHFPGIDLSSIPLGVYGEKIDDDYLMQTEDRLELYRPLLLDPMEARRKRAAKAAK